MRTLQYLRPARPGKLRGPVRPGLALLPLVAAVLLAAGCSTSQSAHGATTTVVPASTTSTTAAPPAASSATSAPAAAATTVTATETEFHIALSKQNFTPGAYTFQAINAGTTIHNLAITGPGVSATSKSLGPGEKANLAVTLQSGSYDVFCAIDGHKALGMDLHITVS